MSRTAYLLCAFCLLPGAASGQSTQTEKRVACGNHVASRQAFFGELHLHTAYSADAATLDTRNTPRDAYHFAKGDAVGIPPFVNTVNTDNLNTPFSPVVDTNLIAQHPYCLPPNRCKYTATRMEKIGRPLDFAAVTDHAEWLGEDNICFFEPTQACAANADCPTGQRCLPGQVVFSTHSLCAPHGYESPACILAREEITRLRAGIGAAVFATAVTTETPQRLPFCREAGNGTLDTCAFNARNVWQQIQKDAEEAYDRTAACSFTSFVAYEYTAMPSLGECATSAHEPCWAREDCPGRVECVTGIPGGNNLHRNIIFRNANVIDSPISNVEAPVGCGKGLACRRAQDGPLASPVAMLKMLQSQCNASSGCDFVSIPHNSNVSGGAMFLLPESIEEATLRGTLEPLTELFQIKGSSECRFSAAHRGAWNTIDELCDFENMSFDKLTGSFILDPDASTIPPGSYVRNALKSGIQFEQRFGVNPFHLGFIGSTDAHDGMPGATSPADYAKNGAHGDLGFSVSGQALNERFFVGLQTNPGGLAVIWAEENSRDSLFDGLKRRETYATSGTRPVVRFFGGFQLPADLCARGDFAELGYARGVPMGGTLRGDDGHTAPRFAVAASWDPGTPELPGARLQRIHIIKGWVDRSGQTHEQVYLIAGGENQAGVDHRCRPTGPGFKNLCTTWTDPDFDPDQHAFYYARVLENPSCRWNAYYCGSRRIDCSRPSDADDPLSGYTQFEYQQCCGNFVPTTENQRAWTSPIWYEPPASR